MPHRIAAVLLLVGARGCVTYEYEHEFRLRVDVFPTLAVLSSEQRGQPAASVRSERYRYTRW